MKYMLIICCLGVLVGCQRQKTLTLPLVIEDQFVLTKADYDIDYHQFKLNQATIQWLIEMNEYMTYVQHATEAMTYLLTETKDTGVLEGKMAPVPEGYEPAPNTTLVLAPSHMPYAYLKASQRGEKPPLVAEKNHVIKFLDYVYTDYRVFKPQLTLIFNDYTTTFTSTVERYNQFYDTLNHENLQQQVVLNRQYEYLKEQYIQVLTCFYHEIYPTAAVSLQDIGFETMSETLPNKEEIEKNLLNYMELATYQIEAFQQFYETILNYMDLLGVIDEFYYIVSLTNQTGVFEQGIQLNSTSLFNQHHELYEQLEQIKQSTLQYDAYILQKIETIYQYLLRYYSMYTQRDAYSDQVIKTQYEVLYGLVNSLIRDIMQDDFFGLSEVLEQRYASDN